MCKQPLTESDERGGLVLGEEAHIVARSINGPRGADGSRENVDGYENLILLCATDHKRIDSLPTRYPVAWLLAKKAAHEKWAEDKLSEGRQRVVANDDESSISMVPLITGEAVWSVVASAHMFMMRSAEGDDDRAASDAADKFLSLAKDYGEIADTVQEAGFGVIRDAQRVLDEAISDLWDHKLFVYGRRLSRRIVGGRGPDMPIQVASIAVLHEDELRKIQDETPSPGCEGDSAL
ncbi:HNH endonuclease [Frigoribacterium faeni]|uniref:HNH endonuclease n=1 Tax=Frigoribacterium faeni TaxID=145483 RepID=UPI00141B28FB|nr:HNH endonuclease [Frigoribacterium faeni]NIJ04248.1 transposase [Frigoribacterium faeni]